MKRLGLLPTLLLLTFVSTASAQEAPFTIGPSFSQYSDTNQTDCAGDPFTGLPISAVSCTWSSVADGAVPNGLLVPGSGTISQVSVKVGAVTGPMKVVVMRAEFQLGSLSSGSEPTPICCTDVAESAVFTPTASSVTTLPVQLPVEVNANPQAHSFSFDLLGLSVLEDGVPIPAAANVHETEEPEEGEPPREVQPETFVESPGMQMSGQTQTAEKGKGLLVLMDAVFNSSAEGSPGGLTGGPFNPMASIPGTGSGSTSPFGPAHTVARLTFASGHASAHISGGFADLTLSCGKIAACTGTVRLQSAPRVVASSARAASHTAPHTTGKQKPRLLTYATGSFKLRAGKQATIKAKLSREGKALARKHKRLVVWMNVTLQGAKPTEISSHAVALRF